MDIATGRCLCVYSLALALYSLRRFSRCWTVEYVNRQSPTITDKKRWPGGPLSDEVKFVSVGSVTSAYIVLFHHRTEKWLSQLCMGRKTLTTRFNTLPSLSLMSPSQLTTYLWITSTRSNILDVLTQTSLATLDRSVVHLSTFPCCKQDHDREFFEVVHIWVIEPGATCAD